MPEILGFDVDAAAVDSHLRIGACLECREYAEGARQIGLGGFRITRAQHRAEYGEESDIVERRSVN